MSFTTQVINAWRGSRWRSCTGFGSARPTAIAGWRISRPAPMAAGGRNGQRNVAQAGPWARFTGYLRVDTVHQGDLEGIKGLYHINAVDEVTQWEVVGATAQISEAWLMPVLEAMLKQFPFQIRGFHSDNGSEFINHNVARLLNKLLVEQTGRGDLAVTEIDAAGRSKPKTRQTCAADAHRVSIPSPRNRPKRSMSSTASTSIRI